MKASARLMAIFVVTGFLLPHALPGSSVNPTLGFSFASPVLDRLELVQLLQAGLRPLGFEVGPVTNVRPNGFFRVTYTSTKAEKVFLSGALKCVTVAIYTAYDDTTGVDASTRASEVQEVLLAQLRAIAGEAVLLFQARHDEPCAHAL